jgi:hypothetical protein
MNRLPKTNVPGPSIETSIVWQQTFELFGKPLELSILALNTEVYPPLFVLIGSYGDEKFQSSAFQERGNENFKFEISGSGFDGVGVMIELSEWKFQPHQVTTKLQVSGYNGLLIVLVAKEVIKLAGY